MKNNNLHNKDFLSFLDGHIPTIIVLALPNFQSLMTANMIVEMLLVPIS